MAGHSKWKTIKHKKAATDAKRGKLFSKMSRLITVAAKQGGGDVDANASLRLAVDKAKAASMPKDNIERAIKKGTGELAGASYEEAAYEGYGPGGVAFYIKTLTDNTNRTVAEMRVLFDRVGGSLGASGSTSYIFDSEYTPSFYTESSDESLLEKVEAFVEKLEGNDDVQDIYHNYKHV